MEEQEWTKPPLPTICLHTVNVKDALMLGLVPDLLPLSAPPKPPISPSHSSVKGQRIQFSTLKLADYESSTAVAHLLSLYIYKSQGI
jgi:hypothetical protein